MPPCKNGIARPWDSRGRVDLVLYKNPNFGARINVNARLNKPSSFLSAPTKVLYVMMRFYKSTAATSLSIFTQNLMQIDVDAGDTGE